MSEMLLIEHCAPTLARIKTANLFSCTYSDTKTLIYFLIYWNKNLNPKGVYLRLMKAAGNRALIYVFRKSGLEEDLKDEQVNRYLKKLGYNTDSTEDVLNFLKKRICTQDDFPHEIGFFLGYPPEDVVGFIENNGKNFKFCGCWKVYSDVNEAEKRFHMYRKCKDVYKKIYSCGKSVNMLTVPVKG
ncbi:MAG: DUF3793 family protein [Anaeromassilibacillus sp.]|nr:DUF3793 family protein [Anaeromassilibacillus sp.]MDY3780468.1 DUF3793 family protein [Candidatus Limousia pullorum]